MSEQENKEQTDIGEAEIKSDPTLVKKAQAEKEKVEKEKATKKEESTLFADPTSFYIDEKEPARKNLPLKIIVALIAVAVVIGAAFAIKALLPEKEPADTSSKTSISIDITKYASDDVEKLTVEGKDYTTVLYSMLDTSSAESTTVKWGVEGVDTSLTDSFGISQAVNSAVSLSALREMEKLEADYGFDKPNAKITVQSRNQKFETYTITVGNVAADRSGYYLKTSLADKVYLVEKETVEAFCKDIYAFANTTVISALTDGDAPAEYFNEGTLIKVDEVSVRGKLYDDYVISFKLNPDKNTAPFMTYVMTQPYRRYADNDAVKLLATPFSNGVYAEGVYTYNATNEDIQKYNLVEPQIVLTIKAGNVQHTIKATRNDDGYYAIILDDGTAIYRVTRDYMSFTSTSLNDYMNKAIFTEMLKNFTDIDVTVNNKTYDFNINVVESEEEEDVYNVTAGTLPLKAENFQNYYAQLLGMTVTEVSVQTPDNITPSMTVRLTRKNGSRTTIEFAQTADRRYHVSVDGNPGGYISTTTYEKLVNYTTSVYEGKEIPRVTMQ